MRKSCSRRSRELNSSFLSAFQTTQVLHISMNAQLTHEPIVLQHFQHIQNCNPLIQVDQRPSIHPMYKMAINNPMFSKNTQLTG